MSSDPLLVGIDLGTTGSRCMIFDKRPLSVVGVSTQQ